MIEKASSAEIDNIFKKKNSLKRRKNKGMKLSNVTRIER